MKFLLILGACSFDGPATRDLPDRPFSDVTSIVEDLEPIVLEESDEVINVTLQAVFDPMGGFLIADVAERQIRSYSPEGALIWAAGALGGGPAEFRNLYAARRLPNGRVLAVERTNRMVLRGANGDTVLAEYSTDLHHVEDVHVLNDSTVLIGGVRGSARSGPRIHMWSIPHQEIVRSFFRPFDTAPNQAAAVTAGWTRFDVWADTVAAVFGVSDSVYVFGVDGTWVRTLPLPSEYFRLVPDVTPDNLSSPRQRAYWLQSFDLVADIVWMTPDTLIVTYQNVVADEALDRQWHIVGMSASHGERLFELTNVPRLVAADPRSASMIFQDPNTEFPNRWLRGTLR